MGKLTLIIFFDVVIFLQDQKYIAFLVFFINNQISFCKHLSISQKPIFKVQIFLKFK
jgi:hypothetical protein